MPELNLLGLTNREILVSISFLLGFLVLAWLARWLLTRVVSQMVAKTGTSLDDLVLLALRRPLYLALILAGLYLSITSLPLPEAARGWAVRVGYATLTAVGIFLVVSVIDGVLKWYSQEMAPRTELGLDDRIASALRWVVPLVAAPLGSLWVLEILGLALPGVKAWLLEHGIPAALLVVLAIAGTFTVSQLGPKIIQAAVRRRDSKESEEEEVQKRARTLAGVFVATAQVAIMGLTFFMLLSEVGINIAPVLAGVGVAGIAVGFGAQSLVKDIIAGLFLILENQYRIGDVVKIADVAGLVEDVNLRRTVLRDLDGVVHVVPNGEIRVASNFTREWSRVNLNVSVAYDTNLDQAIAVINRVCREMAEEEVWRSVILKTPQVLRVDKLGDSGIDIKIIGDTQPIKQWDVMGEIRKRLKEAFDKEGIEIPWPHTKVYFGNSPLAAESKTPPRPKDGGKQPGPP